MRSLMQRNLTNDVDRMRLAVSARDYANDMIDRERARVQALAAELAEVKADRKLSEDARQIEAKQIREAWARIRALEAALGEYGSHTRSCQKMAFAWTSDCDCGFQEVKDLLKNTSPSGAIRPQSETEDGYKPEAVERILAAKNAPRDPSAPTDPKEFLKWLHGDSQSEPRGECSGCNGRGEVAGHDPDGSWDTRECPHCKGSGKETDGL
jgi:hypothetical protein